MWTLLVDSKIYIKKDKHSIDTPEEKKNKLNKLHFLYIKNYYDNKAKKQDTVVSDRINKTKEGSQNQTNTYRIKF